MAAIKHTHLDSARHILLGAPVKGEDLACMGVMWLEITRGRAYLSP